LFWTTFGIWGQSIGAKIAVAITMLSDVSPATGLERVFDDFVDSFRLHTFRLTGFNPQNDSIPFSTIVDREELIAEFLRQHPEYAEFKAKLLAVADAAYSLSVAKWRKSKVESSSNEAERKSIVAALTVIDTALQTQGETSQGRAR
jgi:hypothetical protein